MLRGLIKISFLIITSTALFAQDYVMFQTSILKLRSGEHAKLQAGVKKHNDKFHNGEDGPKAYLWYINTGPNSGNYSWAAGPTTFSHMDKAFPNDHIKDWEKNVSPYADENNIVFMMRDEEMTYNPENEVVAENILMKRIPIKNGQMHVEAVEEAVTKIARALRRTRSNIARRVYRDAFPDGHEEIMLVYPFSSWKEFEGGVRGLPEGFQDSYEKIYGKGSFRKDVIDVLSKHTDGISHEVMTMVK
ncbi:MAG: hypothetical protein VX517_02745 [Candidatus Neomarinimicrobiota bacterium]|nr:hypothetical protein [Candidatus Neomarinimicrobiota bacterium]